jgi:hypothetical protein
MALECRGARTEYRVSRGRMYALMLSLAGKPRVT